MSIPKHAVKNARAAIAGLNVLEPKPPKTILPIAMAKAPPIATSHTGTAGGSDRARIMPVTTALRSSTELAFLRIRLQSHSVATQVSTHVPITTAARTLKNHRAASKSKMLPVGVLPGAC